MSPLRGTTEQSVEYSHQAAAQPTHSNSSLVTTCKQNSPQCQNMPAVLVVCPSRQNRMLQLPNSRNVNQLLKTLSTFEKYKNRNKRGRSKVVNTNVRSYHKRLLSQH